MSNAFRDAFNKEQKQKQEQKQQQQHQSQSAGKFDYGYLTGNSGFTIRNIVDGFQNGGETLENLFKVADETCQVINKENPGYKFTAHKLVKEDYGVNYSCMLIASTVVSKEGKSFTVFHTNILEQTGEFPPAYVDNQNGQRISITRTPSSAYDKTMIDACINRIRTELRLPADAAVTSADSQIIPNGYDSTDANTVKVSLNVSLSCVYSETLTLVRNVVGEPLSKFTSNPNAKFGLAIRFASEKQMGYDQVGLPFRRDAAVRLSSKLGGSNSKSIHAGNTGENILDIYSYTDFEFQTPNIQAYYANHQMPPTQRYMPRQIITAPNLGNRVLMTPSMIALMLVSQLGLAQDQTWMQGFFESNDTDIGLLNILGNLDNNDTGFGKPFNTADKAVGPKGIFRYFTSLVYQELILSIDVPESGPSSWYLSILSAAARGNKSAITRIHEAINVLVGGGFSSQHPMFQGNISKVHCGYYTEKGERYDIRRVTSLIGISKLVHEKNLSPQIILEYVRTMQDQRTPADILAESRLSLVNELGVNVVLTGMADRLTFHPGWLLDLRNALANAGFAPLPESISTNNEMFGQQGYDWRSAGVNSNIRVTGNTNIWGSWGGTGNGFNRTF